MRAGSLHTHFNVCRTEAESRHISFDDKSGKAPPGPLGVIRDRYGGKNMGAIGIGYKLFGSVDYLKVAVQDGTCADIRRIRAGIGFGQGKCGEPFARGNLTTSYS